MPTLASDQIMGVIRHVATFLGGVLAAKGYLDSSVVQSLAAAVATIGGVVWSYLAKSQAPPAT